MIITTVEKARIIADAERWAADPSWGLDARRDLHVLIELAKMSQPNRSVRPTLEGGPHSEYPAYVIDI